MFQQVTIAELYWFESDLGIIIQDRFSLGGAAETPVLTSIDTLVNVDKAWENLSSWVCK